MDRINKICKEERISELENRKPEMFFKMLKHRNIQKTKNTYDSDNYLTFHPTIEEYSFF